MTSVFIKVIQSSLTDCYARLNGTHPEMHAPLCYDKPLFASVHVLVTWPLEAKLCQGPRVWEIRELWNGIKGNDSFKY